MGSAKDPRRCYVRRLTVRRPGQGAVAVVTDLTDGQAYPAEDLLDVYLLRWQIEINQAGCRSSGSLYLGSGAA
jgi:hypothetical protein